MKQSKSSSSGKAYHSNPRGRFQPLGRLEELEAAATINEASPLIDQHPKSTETSINATSSHSPPPPARHVLVRSATTPRVVQPTAKTPALATSNPLQPLLVSPALTTGAVLQAPDSGLKRPGFVRRVTDTVAQALDLQSRHALDKHIIPPMPSYWTDHAYLNPLLKAWDSLNGIDSTMAEAPSDARSPTDVRLMMVELRMLQTFPELGQGEVPLCRDWIEYLLGLNLRQPFSSRVNVGRWHVFGAAAATGGIRGFGPW